MSTPARIITKQAEISLGDGERTAQFIASSNSIDRYGDIVEQDWDLAAFWANKAKFLWSHNASDPPIGWVREFTPNNERSHTVARVEFLPPGVDDFADKLCRMVQLGALSAVSVGFRPIEWEDRRGDGGRVEGLRFLRSELIELSLCTIPANPDAIALAQGIDPEPGFIRRIFADAMPQLAPQSVGSFPLRTEAYEALLRIKRVKA